jgi:pimeloyl-ACP methyl ester carboxylesterase
MVSIGTNHLAYGSPLARLARVTTAAYSPAGFIEGTVEAGGFEITYWEAGTGDPLVVLHGAGGPNIVPAFERLAATARVVYLQLPGFGGSPVNETTRDFADLAGTVAEAVAALGIDYYALLGTSFGGATAAWMAIAHPERIGRLILESPAAFRPNHEPLPSLSPEEVFRALYAHPDRTPQPPPPDSELVAKQLGLVRRVLAASSAAALADRLRGLPVPTMVMFGTRDGLIPPEMGRRYKELIPNCDLVYVYDSAHAIASDRPEAYVDLVSDFLERGEAHIVNLRSGVIHP